MTETEIKQLINYIKKLVAIEVENKIDAAVDKKIKTLVKEGKLSIPQKKQFKQLMSPKQSINKSTNTPVFSKDPTMNKILQETFDQGEWKNMGNFSSDIATGWNNQLKNQYSDFAMESNIAEADVDYGVPDMMQFMKPKSTQSQPRPKQQNTIQEMMPEDMKGRINADALPDFLTKALTRNYEIGE